MSRIFISYRRADSAGYAGRLYDRLSQRVGQDRIFMDIDTIEPGLDFVQVIEEAVGSCDALIVLIGRQWLTVTDATGRRRLDNPQDFVRLEVATALERNIRVIPVLVGGATVPHSTDLPDALRRLARRNALEISDTRFHHDVDRLIETLEKVLGVTEPRPPTPEVRRREEAIPARLPFEPEMILIPAGEFLMGSDPQKDKDADDDEQPQHTLYLPDYYLGKTPVTNAQYAAFVQATGRAAPKHWKGGRPPGDKGNHPVVYVSWHDAIAYCHWLSEVAGKSYCLPSEAEWEKGARGTDGRVYPWGNEWDKSRCNVGKHWNWEGLVGRPLPAAIGTTAVSQYSPTGDSPYGLQDMAGNVYEWTRSLPKDYPYVPADGREDLESGFIQVARGGSWFSGGRLARCACRSRRFPFFGRSTVGFRVGASPGSP
jgi:formylglycine-generating enzyme required for sulfatase activity